MRKNKIISNSIIKSQFKYFPPVWMFCSRRSNSLGNNVHERALRIVYDDHSSSYSKLLMTKNERYIHQQNINVLIKKLKVWKRSLSLSLINGIFHVCEINYNLRNFQKIENSKKKTVKMNLETSKWISYRVPQLRKLVQTEIKDTPSLSTLKKK